MLHLLLLILHHVTVGSLGHHLLHHLLVKEIVGTKRSGEVRVHFWPDVVGCLRRPHLILTVDPNLLAAGMVEDGV